MDPGALTTLRTLNLTVLLKGRHSPTVTISPTLASLKLSLFETEFNSYRPRIPKFNVIAMFFISLRVDATIVKVKIQVQIFAFLSLQNSDSALNQNAGINIVLKA